MGVGSLQRGIQNKIVSVKKTILNRKRLFSVNNSKTNKTGILVMYLF